MLTATKPTIANDTAMARGRPGQGQPCMDTRRFRSRFSVHDPSQPPSQPSLCSAEAVDPSIHDPREQVYAARPENSLQHFERAPLIWFLVVAMPIAIGLIVRAARARHHRDSVTARCVEPAL